MFHFRVAKGLFPKWRVGEWLLGHGDFEGEDFVANYRTSMLFKSMEGILEAGPQLVLQLYIITKDSIKNHTNIIYKFKVGNCISIGKKNQSSNVRQILNLKVSTNLSV